MIQELINNIALSHSGLSVFAGVGERVITSYSIHYTKLYEDYGNCVGIPNIGGEVAFDRGYEGNPIVNAMCLGLMKREELITASASGRAAVLVTKNQKLQLKGLILAQNER